MTWQRIIGGYASGCYTITPTEMPTGVLVWKATKDSCEPTWGGGTYVTLEAAQAGCEQHKESSQ